MHSANHDMLPDWATSATHGELVLGAQLPTKDGRKVGNAHIVDIRPGCLGTGKEYYTVLTDAGSRIHLTRVEIGELFYPPTWVSDVAEVERKFSRDS